MGFNKNRKKDDEDDIGPKFVLVDRKNRKVWHEQFNSKAEAQGKIDYERKYNGVVGNWEIDEA